MSGSLEEEAEPAAEPVRQKRDRDEVFVEFTRSICPVCKVVIDAQVNIRDDKVYLRKRCREHGEFEALVYGDAQMYMDSAKFNKPGTIPLTFQTEVKDGCPSDCGLCPEHKQHACLGIIEVNTGCNLDCPICFADSGHQLNVRQLTKCCVEEITPDGRLIPFCAYNSVGYREQVRADMSGVPVAGVVPNAVALQPILTDSPYGSKVATGPIGNCRHPAPGDTRTISGDRDDGPWRGEGVLRGGVLVRPGRAAAR